MNKQLKRVTRVIFLMFIVLCFSTTMIQVVQADELRANPLNQRTAKNSFNIERGTILVDGNPVAVSEPTGDTYQFTRTYPGGAMYAPVTGYYSRNQGMTGIEGALNQELSGIGNAQFFTRIMRILTGEDPQGSSVELTLNPAAQQAAYEAMAGLEGAVVALDPKTGKVLAMVSTPSFDPSLLSSNNDAQIIENYGLLEQDPAQPLVNRAIGGDLYHPGSTYKLLVAAAAIESGAATPASTFDNPAQLQLPQSSAIMQNASRTVCGPGDKATLETAIIQSCNIPIAELAMEMPRDEVPKMARAFGFEQDLQIPLKVSPSVAPAPLDQAQVALSSIGQLDVRATPLQMAMVAAGIANGGELMKPQLVNQIIAPNLSVEREFTPEVLGNPISEETAQTMTGMMEKVVSDPSGTGVPAGIDGVRVAGKTGTAENGTAADGSDLPFTLWYTGFAPVEDPQIAIAVVVANGGGEAHNYLASSYELPTAIGKRVMEAVLGQ
ncbi:MULTISPECIES: penicillin-binding protein 2 [unclassified Leucobacter]|uniref:peptidoglycan D,D-transpeptidase FtsI family protein n=1 Tax=unclassified Leucobacter TaxID=2621730 RepID=UPI00165E420A|nr:MULTISPECIES: penicillin-binding transpeptidase domain-containing protein [unclassified Leucobacter]MBC9926964.1 penicillin-binding protein [Leucobacter sp. cx-169]